LALEGRSFAELLEAYPQFTEDDLRAALAYAADALNDKRAEPVE
jgi:uncharacterized protein (DUF433 family)